MSCKTFVEMVSYLYNETWRAVKVMAMHNYNYVLVIHLSMWVISYLCSTGNEVSSYVRI